MAALKTAGGGTTDYPFFLRHKISDGTLWCVNGTNNQSYCIYSNESECTANVSNWNNNDVTYSCVQNNFTNSVSESYAGFVVTPTMVSNNPGMTAGTYYLKGGDNGASYNANKEILLSAFGSSYCTDYSSSFSCSVFDLRASANSDGIVFFDVDVGLNCIVDDDGSSNCVVYDDGK